MPFQQKNELDKEYSGWRYSSKTFWSKVRQGHRDDCWSWTGSQSPGGPLFGVYLNHDGEYRPRMTQARRVMWAELHNAWPQPQMSIYNSCGNKTCMNYNHWTLERPRHDVYRNYREQQC